MRYSALGGAVDDIASTTPWNPAPGPDTPEPASQVPARQAPAQHVVRRTRIGGIWVAAALFAVVLLLLLIFILENSQSVSIGYFGAHKHLPLGVMPVVIPGPAPPGSSSCGLLPAAIAAWMPVAGRQPHHFRQLLFFPATVL